MKKSSVKGVVKKVLGHLKEDEKDYRKGIREDMKLKKDLRQKAKNAKRK